MKKNPVIDMNHGSGGKAMDELIADIFRSAFDNPYLAQGDDFAALPELPTGQLVMSTDSYVISPLFFPGGDIGSLAIHGTVNDVAMAGAKPLYVSVAFILEQGFAIAELKKIVVSMAHAAQAANVKIVTGDTKVVEAGKGDGVYINTTGVGVRPSGLQIGGRQARPGDKIVISSSLGDHGIAILSQRENLQFGCDLKSDSAPLNGMVQTLVDNYGSSIRCLRDVTRGGLAAVLNEIAAQSKVSMLLDETAIPVKPSVSAVCELLGLDPLYIANEGCCVCICAVEVAEDLVQTLRRLNYGESASLIGEVSSENAGRVLMSTGLGGSRLVDWPMGELLPRIC